MILPLQLSVIASFLLFLHAISAFDIDQALQKRQSRPLGTGATASQSPTVDTISSGGSSAGTTSPSSATLQLSSSLSSNSQLSSAATQSSFSTLSTSSLTTTSSSKPSSASSTDASTTATLSVSSQTRQVVTTVVTVSGSSTLSQVLTTSALVAVTPTATPSLTSGSSGSGSSGVTASQKRTIIGVVVGVGGAALLGALGLVAWRLWGRRKAEVDSYSHPGSHPSSSGQDSSLFKSTLDQYHKPTGPVNPSSNF